MNLGYRISKLRKDKGLSQEQLAEELYLTRQTISKWELNQSTPDVDYLAKLSNYFGVTTDYLIKGESSFTENISLGERENNSTCIEVVQRSLNPVIPYKWCFCFGTVIMGVSLLGIIAFVICAALNPHLAMINGVNFEGLLGFLIVKDVLWFFVVLVALCVLGSMASVFGVIKVVCYNKIHKQ